MLRSTEVILVLRLAQPAALARRFATGSTRRFRAALLPSAVAHINGENLAAAQALALYLVRHGSLAWRSIFADAPSSPERVPYADIAGKKINANKTI
jgi:hypothetical protein